MADSTERANGTVIPTEHLKGLEYRCIGPHRGGRVVAVAGHPTDPMTFYFGACAGGVWKTTDGGTFWECTTDGYFKTAAVGALAVSESDPNVSYAGMGETTIRGDVSHGDGVYRSTDGGKTWQHLGLADTRHIAKIRIHPTNPDLVYVAALGHAWGPNQERGLYRSSDGGKTWEQILFRSPKAGAIDLSMDPTNPRILYCSFWEAQRTPYSMWSGGPESSLYKSTDGGDSWTEITRNEGLPKGTLGKIGVAVSPAKPDRVWAIVEAQDGAVFRSDDAGETWQRLSEQSDLRRRAWYYMHIYAHPQDPETLWVLNLQAWKSVDGGKTFFAVPTPHGDNHDLWIDPRNPQRMIQGDDGGAYVTFNGGESWSSILNQPTAQFYHVTTDNQIPYRLYGSQQDNTAISIPSGSSRGVISQTEWYEPGGGESGYIAVRPDDPNIVFGGAIGSGFGNGRLLRYDHRTGQERNITVWPEVTGMGDAAKDLKYRFQWTFPIVISPHDPNVLYVASNVLHRSTDEGTTWEVISPDLTRNDPEKLEISGGPITRDNTGVEVHCTIFAFVESPHEPGVFWVGTDDGLVKLSRDAGKTWDDITPPGLPEWALISTLEVSPHDPATAYIAATRYKWDDTKPYLYKTNDYGKTWRNISAGIPEDDFTRVIREDPECRGLLYAGTETGLYASFDDGESWQRLGGNLPVVPIHDLTIKGKDLIVATHGRSFWILDDVGPLRQLRDRPGLAGIRLFAPSPTLRLKFYQGYGYKPSEMVNYRFAGPVTSAYLSKKRPDGSKEEIFLDAGKNPPDGVVVNYFLPDKQDGEVTLTFLNAEGSEIRQFSSKKKSADTEDGGPGGVPEAELAEGSVEGAEQSSESMAPEEQEPLVPNTAGMNRFVWNLRCPEATKVPGDKSTEEALQGPRVPPGAYAVRLQAGDTTQTQSFEVLKDPRVASREDLEAQFKLLLQIRDKLSQTNEAVNRIRDMRTQIEGWEARIKNRNGSSDGLLDDARNLKTKLTGIEEELIQPKADSPLSYPTKLNEKLAFLVDFVDSADAAPAQQQYAVFEELSARVDEQLSALQGLIDGEIADFSRRLREADVPAVVPKA